MANKMVSASICHTCRTKTFGPLNVCLLANLPERISPDKGVPPLAVRPVKQVVRVQRLAVLKHPIGTVARILYRLGAEI